MQFFALLCGGLFLTTPAFDSCVAGLPHLLEEPVRVGMSAFASGDQFASDLIDLLGRVRSGLPAARTITVLCSGNIVFRHAMLQDSDFVAKRNITFLVGTVVAAIGLATVCSALRHASEGDRNVIIMLFVLMGLNFVLLEHLSPRHELLFTWGTTNHLALMGSYFAWFMVLNAVVSASMNYSSLTCVCDGLLSLVYLWAWLAPLVLIARCFTRHVITGQPRMIRRRSF